MFRKIYGGLIVFFKKVIKKTNSFILETKLLPLVTGCKFDVHKKFKRRAGRLLKVLFTFNSCPVSRGSTLLWFKRTKKKNKKPQLLRLSLIFFITCSTVFNFMSSGLISPSLFAFIALIFYFPFVEIRFSFIKP